MALDEPCEPWEITGLCCPGWIAEGTTPPTDPDLLALFEARLAAQEQATRWASSVLWRRSGRKVGVCDYVLRICPPCCYCSPCVCGPKSILNISPELPIVAIDSITDVCSDTIIDPARYGIVNDHGVGLIDETCGWLVGYNCELEIEFSAGWEPDIEALMAGSELACEFVKHCLGEECRTKEFLKLTGAHKRGTRQVILTGLPLVDSWLIEVNRVGSAGMMDPSDAMPYSLA